MRHSDGRTRSVAQVKLSRSILYGIALSFTVGNNDFCAVLISVHIRRLVVQAEASNPRKESKQVSIGDVLILTIE